MASVATVPHFNLCIPPDRYRDVPSRLLKEISDYAVSCPVNVNGFIVFQFEMCHATFVSDIALSLVLSLLPHTLVFVTEGK